MSPRTCRRCGQEFRPSRDFHNFCWECYRATHGDASNEIEVHAHAPFDAVELRWLIQRCHPDKNGNSEISNHVTSELLRMRAEERS